MNKLNTSCDEVLIETRKALDSEILELFSLAKRNDMALPIEVIED
jgi:hypothetical protein